MKRTMTFEEILERDGHLAFTNKGISMRPLLHEGRDVMLIEEKTDRPCKKLDAVLFKRNGTDEKDQYVMHRVIRVNNDGTYWIVGDNCISGETVKEEQIIGVLRGIIRKGKTVPVTSYLYRTYVNTWCRFYHLRIGLLKMKHYIGRILAKFKHRK